MKVSMTSTDTMDKLYLEYSNITEARTEREIAFLVRIDELIHRLNVAEKKLLTSDSAKLSTLKQEISIIADRCKRANRGQIAKWLKKAREAAK